MDSPLSAVLGSIPQLGGAGLLVVIIVLLLRREGSELSRARKAHDEDLAEKNAEIDRLQRRLREADDEIDRLRARLVDRAGRHRWHG